MPLQMHEVSLSCKINKECIEEPETTKRLSKTRLYQILLFLDSVHRNLRGTFDLFKIGIYPWYLYRIYDGACTSTLLKFLPNQLYNLTYFHPKYYSDLPDRINFMLF